MKKNAAGNTDAGFVLLLVLWTTALLGLLGTQLVSRARGEAEVASAARGSATLEAVADGSVNAAIFAILDRSLTPDGSPHRKAIDSLDVTTTATNEAGRINPNSSPFVLLTSFLRVLGLDAQAGNDIATAMLLWRTRSDAALPQYRQAGLPYGPSGMAFQSIDEIGLVLGVTPDLLMRMRPHMSLFKEGDVDIRFADPLVRQALTEAAGGATPLQAMRLGVQDLLVMISVDVRTAGARRFRRSAEVRFSARPEAGALGYSILSWEGR